MGKYTVLLAFIAFLCDRADVSLGDGDFCNSYGPDAANPVYPVGSGTSGHELQYTKAVSK